MKDHMISAPTTLEDDVSVGDSDPGNAGISPISDAPDAIDSRRNFLSRLGVGIAQNLPCFVGCSNNKDHRTPCRG